jgi:hypothetical protein
MNRATILWIAGITFLALTALTIYKGEFQFEGGPIISRARDPEIFWRYVIMQIGFIGFVLFCLSRQAGPRRGAKLTAAGDRAREADPAEERPKLPNYDPEYCGKVVKGGACVCVGLIIAELLVLLLVHPKEASLLWVLAGMFTVLPALWLCNIALRWDHYYAHQTYDSIVNGPPMQLFIDTDRLKLVVVTGWCLFCAIPLFLMLGHCTSLSHYLTVFQ